MRELQQIRTNLDRLRAQQDRPTAGSTVLGWKSKILIAALRHGGWALSRVLGRLSPRAGDYLRRNAGKLADFLERAENLAELPIIYFLMRNGVPADVARDIARAILWFIG